MPINALFFPVFSLAGPQPVTLSDRLLDQLDQIRDFIGGRFDVLELGHTRMLWINRHSMAPPDQRVGLEVNPAATLEAALVLQHGHVVRGAALLTGWDGLGELRCLRDAAL